MSQNISSPSAADPTTAPPFPSHPNTTACVSLPSTPLVRAAYTYIDTHTIPSVRNHTIRSALFAQILLRKLPAAGAIDTESLVLATLLHDLGWSKNPALVSADRRFEVDGAAAARDFVRLEVEKEKEKEGGESGRGWDEARLDAIWYAIALHTTPSISTHAPALTALTGMGILADFLGPNLPAPNPAVDGTPQLITADEFTEVIRAYPRLGFKEEVKGIMCGLCARKPEATFGNFAEDYGRRYVEGYEEKWERQPKIVDWLERGLDATVEFE
jgi:hypothetical protein